MPKAFDACRSRGGRIRRFTGPDKRYGVPAGHYRNVCFLGKIAAQGHLHKMKSAKDR